MKLDEILPRWDVRERHARAIPAPPEAVWRALATADLAASVVVKALMGLRALPGLIVHPRRLPSASRRVQLDDLAALGFGRLAEIPGREVVLGVEGRFWRPLGNLEPFDRERFERPVAAGLARAAWNFQVLPTPGGAARLTTETRVVCGDAASRLRFRLYWLLVRPGSGWIRRVMLAAVDRESRRATG